MKDLGSKVLKTERLTLRPFKKEDAEEMYQNWAHDFEVTKYLTWTPHESVEVTRAYCAQMEEQAKNPEVYHWAIVYGGELIGDITINHAPLSETGIIGYCMAKKFWGKGLMTEALQEVLRYAFEEVGFHRIEGTHAKQNIGSSRVMEKCGLLYEGTKRDGFRLRSTGEWVDIVVRGILKEDYLSRK